MSDRDFLFELGTEELPPLALDPLSAALSEGVGKGLEAAGIRHGSIRRFATPRRLAVLITDLTEQQPDRALERRGPPLAAAFDAAGAPTRAAIAFAHSCGVGVEELERTRTDKGVWLAFRGTEAGAPTRQLMPAIVSEALSALPMPKRMRWGANAAEFVRPVHWALMLFGNEVIDAEILGLRTGRRTFGHRFHHPQPIELGSPAEYEPALRRARVIACFAARRQLIREQVTELAAGLDAGEAKPARALIDAALLDEVTALVEWPVPIAGEFEARFLELPREVVICTVQHHQRYFPVENARGALTRHFITVSNIESRDAGVVRRGNERVVRPRLSDAAFFWAQDRRRTLQEHADSLARVVFQARLGSYADKTVRLTALAEILGPLLGAGANVGLAARLAKADLVTAMVNEFPELQGTMGRYYALAEGLPTEIAEALEEQYLPRFAADRLPQTPIGRTLAIADRLDTLTGIFAIDHKPTGAKDPFALRRAALGVLRILLASGLNIDLAALVSTAAANQPVQRAAAAAESYEFMLERLRGLYAERADGTTVEMLDAVLASQSRSPVDIAARLEGLREFLGSPDAPSLASANKRIGNILKKNAVDAHAQVDAALFTQEPERRLYAALERVRPRIEKSLAAADYRSALRELTSLRAGVDAFFDHVMVMDENLALRNNRLTLLRDLRTLMASVADLAQLPG